MTHNKCCHLQIGDYPCQHMRVILPPCEQRLCRRCPRILPSDPISPEAEAWQSGLFNVWLFSLLDNDSC